ncbi:5'-nucleotidase [bioreactor metagenome]|uniref:5'-nucleotidase n=1 Tax=bioreactor metagenome TaxID=1076179 RepID=A0A645I393_9ZZZZ
MDSGPGIIESLQALQIELGIAPMTPAELLPYIGPPLHQFFPEMFPDHADRVEDVIKAYRRLFEEHAMPSMRPFPGAIDLLADIKKSGRQTCIATCKAQRACIEQAEKMELRPYLDHIYGADYATSRFEKTDVLKELIKNAGIDTNAAIMVGDRMYDLIGAKDVGLPAIGVSYGCGSVEELMTHGADWIVHSVEELRGILFA